MWYGNSCKIIVYYLVSLNWIGGGGLDNMMTYTKVKILFPEFYVEECSCYTWRREAGKLEGS